MSELEKSEPDKVHYSSGRVPVEYKLVQGKSDVFEKEVNKAIKKGFEPIGNVCTKNNFFVQAVVKYEA